MNHEVGRPIKASGMAYAPTNEQGVVFLFGILAAKLGFHVEHVQVRFPDCVARHKGRTRRIEFELWASHYADHRHHHKGADVIVCWENDWEARPKKYRHIEIIDLKKYVGALPRIFVVGCQDTDEGKRLDSRSKTEWNVPVSAQIDDLVVMYRTGSGGSKIKDIWKIVGPFTNYGKRNREGRWPGLQAGLKVVARLKVPVTFSELSRDRVTRHLGVVRKRFIGKTDITDDWPLLYNKFSSKNPSVKRQLDGYL